MNYFSIFYWLTVSDGVKKCFDVFSTIFSVITVISFVAVVVAMIFKAYTVSDQKLKDEALENQNPDFRAWEVFRRLSTRIFYTVLVLCIISWMGYVLTPTKKDCLLIIAGGAVGNFITTDSSAKQLPSDVTKFLHMSLQEQMKDLSSDVKKELGVQQSPKEKLLDKVKSMGKDELIKYLQIDTTIVK
jgi:amino acid transporter